MKFHAFLVAMMAVVGAVAAADQPFVKSAAEALEQAQASALPDGVALTGETEKIEPPANAAATITKEDHGDRDDNDNGKDKDDDKENFGWGLGGVLGGGFGGLGGWGLGGWEGWAVGVALGPTASDSGAAVSPAGPIRWATGTRLAQVCMVADTMLDFRRLIDLDLFMEW
ncbi:hypothetical protein PInf_005681 [Phytophthora infestans]|nr:hypothetical protein PInf_005681 [Phytophthora infestans]